MRRIHPYPGLLLHTLGEGPADRNLKGAATVEQRAQRAALLQWVENL